MGCEVNKILLSTSPPPHTPLNQKGPPHLRAVFVLAKIERARPSKGYSQHKFWWILRWLLQSKFRLLQFHVGGSSFLGLDCGCPLCFPPKPPTKTGANYKNFQGYLPHSFQGSFFLENLQKPRENGCFVKRTMVEKNGESTPRKLDEPMCCLRQVVAGTLELARLKLVPFWWIETPPLRRLIFRVSQLLLAFELSSRCKH